MIKKTLISLLLIVYSVKAIGKPINRSSSITGCINYELNAKKIKLRFDPAITTFQLAEIKVDVPKSIYLKLERCKNKLEVVAKSGDISTEIERIIKSSYPIYKSLMYKMKIHIKDIRVLNNQLPTSNPRLYVAIDFYLENVNKEYELKYSATNFILIGKNFERPLGRVIKNSIEDFHKENRYRNVLTQINSESENENSKGLYTSFIDLESGKPTYNSDYKIKHSSSSSSSNSSSNSLRDKYFLLDKNDKKVKMPVIVFNNGEKSFLNVGVYYPKNYYVEITKITDEYYFIFDQIYDYTQASKNTMMFGGGLIGALAGSAAAHRKSPGLINRKSGRLISYNNREIKKILDNQYKRYQYLIEKEDRNGLIELFRELLANEEVKLKLEKT